MNCIEWRRTAGLLTASLLVIGFHLAGCSDQPAPTTTSPTSAPESQAPRVGLAPLPAGERASVVRVTDGDTITVMLAGQRETVRILGVDTPETKKPRTPVKCGGPEASAYAQGVLDAVATMQPEPLIEPEGSDPGVVT